MDRQYPPPTTPIGSFYPAGYPPMVPPELIQSRSQSFANLSMESLGICAESDVSLQTMQPSSSSTALPRPRRRRDAQGGEYVKHRRTRSGCYTCRQRRVKCDEARPICDRCRKGKRDCTYPGDAASAKTGSSRGKGKHSPTNSSPAGSDLDAEEQEPLSSIPDDDEVDYDDSEPPSAVPSGRKPSSASFTSQGDIVSSSSERPSMSRRASSRPQTSRTNSAQLSRTISAPAGLWSALPNDVKFYLKFHKEKLSYHHYAFKYDDNDFLKTTFLQTAIRDESAALLYAIVSFAAYHHSLTRQDDKISTFLSYFNESINHLQQALNQKPHTVATLLTILQLATIEEFLGNWVNLLSHQKAAHQLLTTLYTPETIMQDETSRKIIAWYIRFDLFVGIMSSGEMSLGREWIVACSEYYTEQAQANPGDLGAQFEEGFSTSRLLATDVALLFAAKAKNTMTDEQFASNVSKLSLELSSFGRRIEIAFTDPSRFVQSFDNAPPLSPEDIVDYRDPQFLYGGEYTTMNFVLLDFWAIELTFKHQLALAQRQPPSPELTEIALKICKMFEAIEHCDDGPPGGVLGCQTGLALATLFLPKDVRHIAWCQRKFALVEQSGYILPSAFRTRMSEQWGIDVSRWWLPKDEGYPSIVRMIREFNEFRATLPQNSWHTEVRYMTGIFGSIQLEDPDSPDDFRDPYTETDRN